MFLSPKRIFFTSLYVLVLTCSAVAKDKNDHNATTDKLDTFGGEKDNFSNVYAESEMNYEQPSQWSPKLNDPNEDEFSWKLGEIEDLRKNGKNLTDRGVRLLEDSIVIEKKINALQATQIDLLKQKKEILI